MASGATGANDLFLEHSRELRIHLRAWDEGQLSLLRTIDSIAPYLHSLDDLRFVLHSLRMDAEARVQAAPRS